MLARSAATFPPNARGCRRASRMPDTTNATSHTPMSPTPTTSARRRGTRTKPLGVRLWPDRPAEGERHGADRREQPGEPGQVQAVARGVAVGRAVGYLPREHDQ